MLSRLSVSAEVSYPKFSSAELVAELITSFNVTAGGILEDGELGGAGGRGGGFVVFDGERVRFLVLSILGWAL